MPWRRARAVSLTCCSTVRERTTALRNVRCTEPRGLAYHRCMDMRAQEPTDEQLVRQALTDRDAFGMLVERYERCLLYTSDAADDLLCVDLGGRRIIKKKKKKITTTE